MVADKLAAEVICERAAGIASERPNKMVHPSAQERAARSTPKNPVGVLGSGPIAFGGGGALSSNLRKEDVLAETP